jgi:hypothetical protein
VQIIQNRKWISSPHTQIRGKVCTVLGHISCHIRMVQGEWQVVEIAEDSHNEARHSFPYEWGGYCLEMVLYFHTCLMWLHGMVYRQRDTFCLFVSSHDLHRSNSYTFVQTQESLNQFWLSWMWKLYQQSHYKLVHFNFLQ